MEKYSKPMATIILFEEQDVIIVSKPGDWFEGDDFPARDN